MEEKRDGYVASVVGGALGASGGLTLGYQLGALYADRYMPYAELEAVFPAAVGGVLGLWIGTFLGVAIALWLARDEGVWGTAARSLWVFPFIVMFVGLPIFLLIDPETPFVLTILPIVVCVGVSGAIARRLWIGYRALENRWNG